VLIVNLLAALNFANIFLNKKRLKNKKNVKNVKNVTKIKNVKSFLHLCLPLSLHFIASQNSEYWILSCRLKMCPCEVVPENGEFLTAATRSENIGICQVSVGL